MFRGVSHIGIAVKDLNHAIRTYSTAFDVPLPTVHDSPEAGLRAAMIDVGGSHIELMEPTGEGVITRFVERRGEGIHHICIEVDDLPATLARLESRGIQLVDRVGRPGLEGDVAFVDPRSMHNVLIELVQKRGHGI